MNTNSTTLSTATLSISKIIGSKCDFQWECYTNVPSSYCDYRNLCQCQKGFEYHKSSDTCYQTRKYGDDCSPNEVTFLKGCRNPSLICSDDGICICQPGHYFDDQIGGCLLNNSTSCNPGDQWHPLRNRCVTIRPFDSDIGDYERNRYSLLVAIILVLIIMIVLFKSKFKPNPFVVETPSTSSSGNNYYYRPPSRRSSHRSYHRSSYPETLIPDPRFYHWNRINMIQATIDCRGFDPRLSTGAPYPLDGQSLADGQTAIDDISCNDDLNNNFPCDINPALVVPGHGIIGHHNNGRNRFCLHGHQPPPPYSSNLNLANCVSGSQVIEKPPAYDEVIDLNGESDLSWGGVSNEPQVINGCSSSIQGCEQGGQVEGRQSLDGNHVHIQDISSEECPSNDHSTSAPINDGHSQ